MSESQNSEKELESFKRYINKFKSKDELLNEKPVKTFKSTNYSDKIYQPLTDSLKFGLDILFIGINPGLQSSLKNHHFAGPTNAFWPALCESGLVNEKLTFEDDVKLLKEYNYGFTNLVERASRSISDLSRKEIMLGVPVLKQKISKYRPRIACFLGKQIFECFSGNKKFELGLQVEPIVHGFDKIEDKFDESIDLSDYTKTYLFVTPSTSGRSARFSRQQKIDYFVNVKQALAMLRKGLNPL